MNKKSFHHDHLADLKRSGLTDETIHAAGIYTVQPSGIGRKLGGGDGSVVSLLAFPYPGCDGFERYRCFYEDGKSGPKYRQPKGAPNRLYLPPAIDLQGDSSLLIVEGEKKALAVWQAGFLVVGLSGVWNWLTKGDGDESEPIADLELVNWRRPVTIVFDSDGHDNHMVRLAAFRLARELSQRGATVSILFLPPGQNGKKVGADDFLVDRGPTTLEDLLESAWTFKRAWDDCEAEVWWLIRDLTPQTSLPEKLKRLGVLTPILSRLSNLQGAAILEDLRGRLNLRADDLADLRRDVKRERRERDDKEKKASDKSKVFSVQELEEGFRLHPAIDFFDGAMSIGFRVDLPENDTGLLLVVSDGQGVRADVSPDVINIGGRTYQVIQNMSPPFLQDRWNLEKLKAFVEHPTKPQNLFTDLKEAFRRYLDLPEPAYGLLAAWTVGTYFAHLFAAFPFLHFHGPKESGKSKTLKALNCMSFNSWKGRDISPAALGDMAEGQRGTLLLDQAEGLSRDQENLLGLLADSYKRAGGKRRVVEITKTGRSVLEFPTYGPKAFASTKNLDPDLADRVVRVPMTRTQKPLPDLEGWEPIWGELRDKLYRFSLVTFKEVRSHYQETPGGGKRIKELWRPLLAVLLALEVKQAEIEDIWGLFIAAAEETRHEPTPWESRMLEILQEEAAKHTKTFELMVSEVIGLMGIEGDKQPSHKWVGDILSQYHLYHGKGRPKIGGKKETTYKFDPARVTELCSIYLRESELDEKVEKKYGVIPHNDLTHLSSGNNANDFNSFYGTGKNQRTRPHLSPLGDEGHGGHEWTCPPEMTSPLYDAKTIAENRQGHEGQEQSGGTPEINSSFFPDEDIKKVRI